MEKKKKVMGKGENTAKTPGCDPTIWQAIANFHTNAHASEKERLKYRERRYSVRASVRNKIFYQQTDYL